MHQHAISQVRRFNRIVTQRIGVLEDSYLGRDRPLAQSRLLFEIGNDGAELRHLRQRLHLDSGYLSRLVRALEARGLVEVLPLPSDGRVNQARLTDRGRAELKELNRLSDQVAETTLGPLSENQRTRLLDAMGQVERLLMVSGLELERVDPTSPDARHCLAQYYQELGERFEEGFDVQASIPTPPDELTPPRGAFLVVRIDAQPIACGALMTMEPGIGYLRRMWVSPSVRGLGLGRRLLAGLEDQARELGMTTVRLETNRALEEAVKLYESSGYCAVEPFNQERYAHHWFEKDLD